MSALSATSAHGTLTGSGTQDTIATAGASVKEEAWSVYLRNRNAASRTVTLYINGITAAFALPPIPLAQYESILFQLNAAPNDVLYAEASAGTSVDYFFERGVLT